MHVCRRSSAAGDAADGGDAGGAVVDARSPRGAGRRGADGGGTGVAEAGRESCGGGADGGGGSAGRGGVAGQEPVPAAARRTRIRPHAFGDGEPDDDGSGEPETGAA